MAETVAHPMTNWDLHPDEVVLISADKHAFIAHTELIKRFSGLLRKKLEDLPNAREVHLQNVNGSVLAKVLEYVFKHGAMETQDGEQEGELDWWDLHFIKVDQPMLFQLIQAANYLDSQKLLELACLRMAKMMTGNN